MRNADFQAYKSCKFYSNTKANLWYHSKMSNYPSNTVRHQRGFIFFQKMYLRKKFKSSEIKISDVVLN